MKLAAAVRIAAAVLAGGGVLTAAAPGRPQTAPPAQTQQGPRPSFRSNVDVVSLNVTVTEPTVGIPRYVTDLDAADFEVYEDGVKQEISTFNKTNSPIGLALLIDSSASMDAKMSTAQEAAIGFVRKLREHDVAEVIEFDDTCRVLQDFTNDAQKLERAIRLTSAGGATAMFQALYIAMNEFKKLKRSDDALSAEPRRQAVVLLSDGDDTKGLFDFDDILDIVKRSETGVYTIGRLGGEEQTTGFRQADFYLRQLAQQTGGRAFFPKHLSELAGVYGEIADELSSQYSIGYTSKNTRRDGSWRRVVVRTTRTNTATRTKQGYFAPRG